MPLSSRRPHTKSRLGCQQCKKQRTKCDEKRPCCTRCLRTGASCSLAETSSSLFIVNSTLPKQRQVNREHNQSSEHVPVSESRTRSSRVTEPSPDISLTDPKLFDDKPSLSRPSQPVQIADAERTRLRLMNHYSRSTAKSIGNLTSDARDGSSIWEVDVPELAFKNDFLLHGMLSISALHLAMLGTSPKQDYIALAVEHHNQGIMLYTSYLMNITAENIDSLFAFACLTCLYSFGIHFTADLKLSPLVKIYECFTMIAGTGLIVKSGFEWLQAGIWGPWFRPHCKESVTPLSREVEEVMAKLRRRVDTTITTSSQSQMYLSAIGALEDNFRQYDVLPRNQLSIVMLPVKCPPDFQQMVCIGEPLALSILGNWAVILHWLREHIWLSNWGSQTVKVIHETLLPPEWQDCMTWAMSEIENSRVVNQLPTPNENEFRSTDSAMTY